MGWRVLSGRVGHRSSVSICRRSKVGASYIEARAIDTVADLGIGE